MAAGEGLVTVSGYCDRHLLQEPIRHPVVTGHAVVSDNRIVPSPEDGALGAARAGGTEHQYHETPEELLTMWRYHLAFLVLILLASLEGTARSDGDEILFTEGLAAGPIGRYSRSAVCSDPIFHQVLEGTLAAPLENALAAHDHRKRERRWTRIEADAQGWLQHAALRGGYLAVTIPSERERIAILEASGHSLVFVNGMPRGGDVYSTGWMQLPVRLEKGDNLFLFRVSRGRLKARLIDPPSPVGLSEKDRTLPDVVIGDEGPLWGAVVVVNATQAPLRNVMVRSRFGDEEPLTTALPPVGPLTTRKIAIPLRPAPVDAEGTIEGQIALLDVAHEPWRTLATQELKLKVCSPSSCHRKTFLSAIDGSVQYYGFTPGTLSEDTRPALFLSLHGAGVEAIGQARCYAAKDWGHVVAPTNRRPYGFDWEDWGRLDALEVLELALRACDVDPGRVYLTGHSMGGHGTWQIGVTYPDRFAAIGPSAGWISFWSYAGSKQRLENKTPVEELLTRASSPSDTLALSRNFLHHGIYVLHGDKDDNVPVEQARTMRKHLSGFHADFAYYERPGAGHWWGNRCCDWPPLFGFFEHHRAPDIAAVNHVEFYTANPGISSRSRWASIEAQEKHLALSSIDINWDGKKRTFSGTTSNVARLLLDVEPFEAGENVTITLDGQELGVVPTPAGVRQIRLERRKGAWRLGPAASDANLKGPHRYGTFKDAFRHRVMFVYGTRGTAEENAWAYAKARFDGETFRYRANGSIDLIADRDLEAHAEPDRGVILYGHAEMNSAWSALLEDCPVQVTRGRITVGSKSLAGDDLGCYFIYPRPGSDRASVGVVAGSGPKGMRACFPNMYFISGAAFPDLFLFGSDMFDSYMEGVRCVGFFGGDWSVEAGEFAWR